MERIRDLYQFMRLNGDINLPSTEHVPGEIDISSSREVELPGLAEIWDNNSNAKTDNMLWGCGGEDKGISEI